MDSENRAIRYIFIVISTLILTVGSCQMHLDYRKAELIKAGIDPVCVAGSLGEVTAQDLLIMINRNCNNSKKEEGTK